VKDMEAVEGAEESLLLWHYEWDMQATVLLSD